MTASSGKRSSSQCAIRQMSSGPGTGRVARQLQRSGPRVERLELAESRAAENLQDPRAAVHGGRSVHRLPAVGAERERHRGIRQGRLRDDHGDGAGFGLDRCEELSPGRRRLEEALDEHVRPAGPRGDLPGGLAAVVASNAHRGRVGARAIRGGQGQLRDRGDRGQRLPSESVRRDAREIVVGRDLRGRMALERQPRVLRSHARAVVANEDPVNSAAIDLDVDPRRPRVEGVLHELLDRRSGPLDDLARGDSVDHGARQFVDTGHGGRV